MPTTLQTFIDEVRTSPEDYGDTITDQFTGDGVTTRWKASSTPIKSNTDTVTIGGVASTAYTINYDNGELLFNIAPGSGVVVQAQYVKVVWRDERVTSGINAGIRELYPKLYKIGECYVALRPNVQDYDLTSTTDVPATAFGGQAFPADYTAATARADLVKAQTRIHWYEYRPYGSNQLYTPYDYARRTTPRNVHIDGDPAPSDSLKIVYSAPFTVLVNTTDVTDVPDEFYMLPVWYALSVLMEKKEAKRARFDQYAAMQNTQAVPPGTQAQTAEDYLKRYYDTLQTNAMRPLTIKSRKRLRSWQFAQRSF